MSDTRKSETGPVQGAEWADDALDALFAEARDADPATLSDAFAARLMAGAQAEMPAPAPGPMRGWLSRLGAMLSEIGGAPGVAGVGAAGLAGVWIGFSGPGVTGDLLDQFWQGAAQVSPTVSTWVATDLTTDGTGDLLSLLSGTLE